MGMFKVNEEKTKKALEKELERLQNRKEALEKETNMKMKIKQLRDEILILKKKQFKASPVAQIGKPLSDVGKKIWNTLQKIEIKPPQNTKDGKQIKQKEFIKW